MALATGWSVLTSCALIGSHPLPRPAPEVEAPPPPPAPRLADPVDTHKFELTNPDDDVVGAVQITIASQQDTLPDIARRFNVGYEEIVRANPGVDPWLPGAGRSVVVPTRFVLPDAPRQGIVINVAALRLYYFPPHKKGEPQIVYTHPIGIGKVGWSTPQGTTTVVSHVKDPIWRPSVALRKDHFNDNGEDLPAVVKPGPDNPLGKFELTLGWRSYLIHGTNKPYGVGLRSSHGCIRLYPEDIERIYAMVTNGTAVRVVNQPFLFGSHDQQLYLQAYSVLQDDPRDWDHAQKKLLTHALSVRLQKTLQVTGSQIDWQSVAAITHAPRGIPVPVTGAADGIDAVLAAAPRVENRIPEGADWDGSDDTGSDAASAKQLLLEREPTTAQAPSARAPGT
ncbi:MAG TPA: L,D-transpeptidase family protein [Steroidobacteraceae bacterium]|nr:L,D-transpeptidase family protein [Steroidobacteraceae bacterium]